MNSSVLEKPKQPANQGSRVRSTLCAYRIPPELCSNIAVHADASYDGNKTKVVLAALRKFFKESNADLR